MAGNLQPLDEKFPIVGADGRPTLYFIKWAQQRQIDITESITLQGLEDYLAAHKLQEGSGIQFTPDGNIANSPIIAADVQEILDQISTTRGVIIYRGLTGWAALVPGAAGQVLQTNGAGADPAWAAAASGGYGYEAAPTIPAVAGFTLQNAGTASMANSPSGRGIILTVPTVASNIRFVRKNGAPPATPYKATIRYRPITGYSSTGAYHGCVILRNNTSGRILIAGDYNNTQHLFQRWTNYTTFSANVLGPSTIAFLESQPWVRLRNDGANVVYERSPDGEHWQIYGTDTLAGFINAAGGTVDECGFGFMMNGIGFTCEDLFQSFTAA